MKFIPVICPKCGSVNTVQTRSFARCLESDCNHEGPKKNFKTGRSEGDKHSSHKPNENWRDGSALSMDGTEEN